jgi:polyketide synthase family protein/polyketide synthase-like dehydratase family protein
LRIQINPEEDTFLLDHVVDGSPVLPTVMQLDLVARALHASGQEQPAGLLLRDIVVGPPVRFAGPGPRDLDLLCTPVPSRGPAPPAWRCELRSPNHHAPHLVAVAGHAAGSAPWARSRGEWENWLSCGPDLVYPPFFHGPAFQVVGSFGREGGGLRAALAPGLPPLSWGCGPTVLRPRLLELLLQCCGLQELAETGRMMVPAGFEAVHWHLASLAADDRTKALAVARPRRGRVNYGRVFDGQVVTLSGEVLVTVTGYRTADLGQAARLAYAARLSRALASQPEPGPRSATDLTIPEGASR